MKYFTKQIWAGWQSSNKAVLAKVNREWKKNVSAYRKQFDKLFPKLGEKAQIFFKKHSLHDGLLVSVAIVDSVKNASLGHPYRQPTKIELTVLAWFQNYTYTLTYIGIKSFNILSDNTLFPVEKSIFGDWGYDELIPNGRKYLQHNILFQTGTEISIVFEDFSFARHRGGRRQKLKGRSR